MARGTWQGSGTWQTSGGGGGGALALIVAAVLIGSGAVAAVVRALELILVILGCAAGLTIVLCVAWAIWQARQDRPGRPIEARPVVQLPPEPRPQLEESHKPAIGPAREVHLHIHVADAAQAAAIIRTAIPGTAGDATTEGN